MSKKVRHSIKSALRTKKKHSGTLASEVLGPTATTDEEPSNQKSVELLSVIEKNTLAADKTEKTALPKTTLLVKEIQDFYSIHELKKHLSDCYQEKTDFHLKKTSPENDILKFIVENIKEDNNLSQFSDALTIVELLSQISTSQNQIFKDYEHFLNEILRIYHKKITSLLKDTDATSALQTFFTVFNKNKKINTIKAMDGFINPFSNLHKAKETIQEINEQYKAFTKTQELSERQSSQSIYWELLENVLNEKNSSTLLHLTAEQQRSKVTLSTNLLSDEEYDAPSAEPEHPSRIGINETMSFKPVAQRSSLLDIFSTPMLQKEFMENFSWAMDSVLKLKKAKSQTSLNLLGTDTLYPPELQIAVLQYILLSLDAIGKIVGNDGQLVLKNFILVKKIVATMESVSNSLNESEEVNNTNFLNYLHKITQELIQYNVIFYEAQSLFNPDISVEKNPKMNVFCHVNELLIHILMNQTLDESLMLPSPPDSPDAENLAKIRHRLSNKGPTRSTRL